MLTALEAAPDGLITVTLAVPPAAIRLEGTVAVNCEELTNVVLRKLEFHCTVAPLRKPLPLTVRVNDDPPASTEVGLSEEMNGPGAAIVKVIGLDAVPPGFTTATEAVPTLTIRAAGTNAVTWFELMTVVDRKDEFHCTVAPEAKPEPLTVSVNPGPPEGAAVGLSELRVGPEAPTANDTELEATPPGFS